METLLPELEACLSTEGPIPMIRHPLVHLFFVESHAMIQQANACYKHKLQSLHKAIHERDWKRAIFLFERPYRPDALEQYAPMIEVDRFWTLLPSVYIDCEFPYRHYETFRRLFSRTPLSMEGLMSDDERAVLNGLPQYFPIYRGAGERSQDPRSALSWTTSMHVATWFASRFGSQGVVFSGIVKKDDVIAYFNRRGEDEIIVFPETIFDVRVAKEVA
jgi:hypothetical protein